MPPLDLLSLASGIGLGGRHQATIGILTKTLEQFQCRCARDGYTPAPPVTRYEIELGEVRKVNRV